MSDIRFLVTGATGATGSGAATQLLDKGRRVRAFVHREDERSESLRRRGAEVVVGDLLDFDVVREALKGVNRAYFVYPIRPGLVQATAQFAQSAVEAGVDDPAGRHVRTVHDRAACAIAGEDQGRVIVGILENPEPHRGKIYPLYG